MTIDVRDIRSTIVPKSDQLNSEQLLSGPIVITVTGVDAGSSKEQPLTVHYEGENGRPYKPCLTMRKVLAHGWGHDATQWAGRSMELYCDPSVRFGGETVGGIRISAMTDIPKDIKVALTASKGKKALHEIARLVQSPELVAALAAVAAGKDKASMGTAKELCLKLKNQHELATAQAAYARKVADLKAQAVKPPADVPRDLPYWQGRITACSDAAVLQVIGEEAAEIEDAELRDQVLALVTERDEQLPPA